MKKNIVLIMIVVFFICYSFSVEVEIIGGSFECRYSLNSTSSELDYIPGTIIVVELESNPTTGYSWNLLKNYDEKLILSVENSFFQEKNDGKNDGMGGIEKFVIQTSVETGVTDLQFVYKREWENEDDSLTYVIRVESKLSEAILPVYNLKGFFNEDDFKVYLDWENSDSCDYYKIYRKIDVGDYYLKFLNISTSKKFIDGPMAHPGSVHYGVSAVEDGIESDIMVIQINVE
ncbi:MAG: inhibitor of cysteine peptidase [Kosmotogales bacterium]|nr:inhibitor of cysteine peptidase [Kosmotogales bacterium]